ncbi:helicase [Streptomyces sp. A0642]|nr:helicase [Streptomyces sp. A0642]
MLKLGVRISRARARCEELAADQLAAIAALGVDWA